MCVRVASLAFGLWMLASSSHAQDAQTLIAQMKSAEARVSYSATQSGATGTARVFKSGLKRRLEWLSPSVKQGDILLDDGASVYLYHRAEKSATKTNSRGHVPSFVAVGKAKATTYAGRRAFAVPVSGNRTLTIDAQTKALLAVSGGNGGGYSLSGIKFGAVPAAKFDFTAPAGVKVSAFDGALYANLNAARRAASWLKTPPNAPAGWSFESAIVGTDSAWLRYSNGQNRISLFEQPTKDQDMGPQSVDGGGIFWKKSGVRFLATGTPPSALQSIVDELK